MEGSRTGQIVVAFISQRRSTDPSGYAEAAAAMSALAATQPGFCGEDHVSNADCTAITLSYWRDETSAIAWREHPEHIKIREAGRGRWYDWYMLHVAEIGRSYQWSRA